MDCIGLSPAANRFGYCPVQGAGQGSNGGRRGGSGFSNATCEWFRCVPRRCCGHVVAGHHADLRRFAVRHRARGRSLCPGGACGVCVGHGTDPSPARRGQHRGPGQSRAAAGHGGQALRRPAAPARPQQCAGHRHHRRETGSTRGGLCPPRNGTRRERCRARRASTRWPACRRQPGARSTWRC